MEHTYVHLLHLLDEHAAWSLLVVFLASFFEAIALIGTFVPGSTTLFIAGALVGTGALNLGWLFACAIAGAIAGDGTSYWIGHRYRSRICQLWPFRTHPAILGAGQQYFARQGARSVVFARFIAPLRAVVPVIAGMVGMSPMRFYTMNVISALIWAPAHILPGVVFGASMQLAGAVSFRLVAVLAILVGLGWLSFWVARQVLSHARAWSTTMRHGIANWARHHGSYAARVSRWLLDPRRPAAGVLATTTLFVLVAAAIFFGALKDVVNGDPIVQLDLSVYRFLQSIHSPWADTALSAFMVLGSLTTLAALVMTVVVWLLIERRWKAVAYWIVAVAFSQLLILAIQLTVLRIPPSRAGAVIHTFPSDHVVATVTVYGFLTFLLCRRVGTIQGVLVTTVSTAIVVAVAFAGLYSGRFLFSDAVGGAAFAAIWVALVAVTIMWRYPKPPPGRGFMPMVVLLILAASAAPQLAVRLAAGGMPGHEPSRPVTVVTQAQWIDAVWKTFPCFRSDMKGDRREPITVQWVADQPQIEAQLKSRGWVEGTQLSVRSVLSLVAPAPAAAALPVLPKLNNGEPSLLVFTRALASPEEREVLRFWPTGYAVERRNGHSPAPIWIGSLVHERLRHISWPFNVLRVDKTDSPVTNLTRQPDAWREFYVSNDVGCEGIPVMLIASNVE